MTDPDTEARALVETWRRDYPVSSYGDALIARIAAAFRERDEQVATLRRERDEARQRVARCHEIISAAREKIDPEEHPDWDEAAYAEQAPCDRTYEERDALAAQVIDLRAELRARDGQERDVQFAAAITEAANLRDALRQAEEDRDAWNRQAETLRAQLHNATDSILTREVEAAALRTALEYTRQFEHAHGPARCRLCEEYIGPALATDAGRELTDAVHALYVAASLAAPLVDEKWLERKDLDRALVHPALARFRA